MEVEDKDVDREIEELTSSEKKFLQAVFAVVDSEDVAEQLAGSYTGETDLEKFDDIFNSTIYSIENKLKLGEREEEEVTNTSPEESAESESPQENAEESMEQVKGNIHKTLLEIWKRK